MYFLAKIILYVLFHTTAAIEYVDLAGGMKMTWEQTTLSFYKAPYNITSKYPFFDFYVDKNEHKLALLTFHYLTEDHPLLPNLTVRTHHFNGKIDFEVCSVDLPFKDDHNWIFPESVVFLKSNKVLISWKADHKTEGLRVSSQVISIDNCKSSEFIDIKTEFDQNNFFRSIHMIIQLKDSFGIIFKNEEICPKDYCKLMFDYDGSPLSTSPQLFSKLLVAKNETLHINSLFPIEIVSEVGVVVTGNKNGIFYSPTSGLPISHDVYSPTIGWTKAEGLHDNHHIFTNSSGFATLCWTQHFQEKFVCKWLDGTNNNKDGSEKLLVLNMKIGSHMPWILNSRDGKIILIHNGFENKTKVFFVDQVSDDGKCRRLMKIIRKNLPINVKLSITENNDFCFSFIMDHIENNESRKRLYVHRYSFITKCINVPKDMFGSYIDCEKCFK